MRADAATPADDFEHYREYLHLLARVRLGRQLQGKVSPSDLVQDTLLKAHEHRADFRGRADGEKAAYLRRILSNAMADAVRRFTRDKRDAGLERSLNATLGQSTARLEAWLAVEQTGPGTAVDREELLLRLASALAALPEAQREAVEMRYLHDPVYRLAEIAHQMNRSEKAVAGLLCRGLETLRTTLRMRK